jgi:predicted nucleotidyltransferase
LSQEAALTASHNRDIWRLAEVASQLDKARVKWGVFAGAAVSAFLPMREVTDIDLIVRRDHLRKVDNALAKKATWVSHKYGRTLGIILQRIDIVLELQLQIGGREYCFYMDKVMEKRLKRKEFLGINVPFVSCEDTAVLKTILQRGQDEGKRDIEDIKALLDAGKIDLRVLSERLRTFNAWERGKDLFGKLGHPLILDKYDRT